MLTVETRKKTPRGAGLQSTEMRRPAPSLRETVDKKERTKPFVPGDPSNGNMFVFFGVAGLTKNWRSERDQLGVAYNV
jgi:hypothetical protein